MNHTATPLEDGRVLFVGGEDVASREPVASVEIFDPATGAFAAGPDLPAPRANHRAVRLPDGRVLVMGGGRSAPIGVGSGLDVTDSALLFDPARGGWEVTGSLRDGRSHFGAARLPSGRVLVAGGASGSHAHGSECTGVADCGPLGDTLASVEIYDPERGAFVPAPPLAEARMVFALESLSDGRVIAVGGVDDLRRGRASSEIFDERSGRWTPGPALLGEGRLFVAAAVLGSGELLVGGGKIPDVRIVADAQVLTPGGGARRAAALSVSRTASVFVGLPSGRVLSVGGFTCEPTCAPVAAAEIFDAATDGWRAVDGLRTARAGHSVTWLPDGRLLVCGGFGDDGTLASCEVSVSAASAAPAAD